ncbi:hypothetical protein KR215_010658, partial [Drosophila sulfurigaster]
KTFANLWTRLRSPRPNRASGGYLLTGTSATREDELLGVTGRRTRLAGTGIGAGSETETEAAAAAGGWRNECLINVTDFSDFQAAVTVTETEPEEPITVTELRVPSITTTSININNGNANSTSNNINNSTSNNNNNNNNNNQSNNNSNNMSRILQPRYRFRDLLLGDFSFNDDGER